MCFAAAKSRQLCGEFGIAEEARTFQIKPWNLDCIRFSFHLMECQTALTWFTYAKCRAIHMVSGAGYVFFSHVHFIDICEVKIWKVTTALVIENNAETERETRGPCCPLCMQRFHFHTRQQEIQRSQLEPVCVSPQTQLNN